MFYEAAAVRSFEILSVCLQGLIFVVDSNDPERIKEASEELHTLVKRFKLIHSFVFHQFSLI